jgi:sec-independent protein translocase protein TatB
MDFFDIGFFEIVVVLVVALIVVGPEKLPEYARKFGKVVRDLRKMTKNFTGEMSSSLGLNEEIDDLKKTAQGLQGSLDEESQKIKNALDLEADEIAKTIDNEVKDVKKSLNDGTADLSAMLEKESLEFDKAAKEIKTPLDSEAKELNKTLNEGVKKVNKSLNVDNNVPAKKGRTAAADKAVRKKTGETPEKLDTVEKKKPQDELTPAQVEETGSPDKKAGSEEIGI